MMGSSARAMSGSLALGILAVTLLTFFERFEFKAMANEVRSSGSLFLQESAGGERAGMARTDPAAGRTRCRRRRPTGLAQRGSHRRGQGVGALSDLTPIPEASLSYRGANTAQ